jgi:hypothetical protein
MPRGQVWYAAYPSGTLRSITNDLTAFNERSLGITADAGTLVASSFERRSNIWVVKRGSRQDEWGAKEAKQLTSGVSTFDGERGLSWLDNHTVVYTVASPTGPELWTLESDGSQQRRFPMNIRDSYNPAVSPDGKI